MASIEKFARYQAEMPIIAILRGIQPHEVLDAASALIDSGILMIEIPLNSPSAYSSIEILIQTFKERALCGAGTVLETGQLAQLRQIGAELVVTPNCNSTLIKQAIDEGFTTIPGFMTATEMFQAITVGAQTLKFFPAVNGSEHMLAALKSVAPPEISFFPTGGIKLDNMSSFWKAGARGFGVGSALYTPGVSPIELAKRAKKFIIQLKNLL